MSARFRPIAILQIILGALLILCLCAIAIFASGCIRRTAEVGTIHLVIPERAAEALASGQLATIHIAQTLYAGDIDIGQGQSVPIKALSDLAASAAQTGDPTATLSDDSAQTAAAKKAAAVSGQ